MKSFIGVGDGQNLVGFRVINTRTSSPQAACKLLVITAEHIDNLLCEWYPKIDTFVNMQGVKAIRRISFCDRCVGEAVDLKRKSAVSVTSMLSSSLQEENFRQEICGKEVEDGDYADGVGLCSAYDILDDSEVNVEGVNITFDAENGEVLNHYEFFNTGEDEVNFAAYGLHGEELELMLQHRELGKGKLIAFELEEASKLLRENRSLLCPFHFTVDPKDVFPDLVRGLILLFPFLFGRKLLIWLLQNDPYKIITSD